MSEETKDEAQPVQAGQTEAAAPAVAAPADQTAPVDALPANKVTIEDCGQSKKKITIEVDRKRIDAKFDEIFGELGNTALVPGFRVGHAPRRLLEKRFAKEAGQDVRNALISEALGAVDEEHKLQILGEPDIKLDEIELPDTGNLIFSVEVEIKPQFDLPDYKAIPVEEPVLEATPERIQQATRRVLASRGTLAPTQEPAGEGDLIVADVKIAGEGIDAGHENMELRVAPAAVSGIPLADLGEKLTGAKAGQTLTLEATVPDSHQNEAWRGKKAAVSVEIKEVKRLEVPELTDALAQEFGLEDAGRFGEFIKRNLESQLATERQEAMRGQVCRYLLDKTQVPLPEGITARHAARMLSRRYVDLLYRGVPREQIDQNLEMLQAQTGEESRTGLALSFILDKIAEAEGITVDEGEVNASIAQMAARQGRRPERMRSEMANQGTLDQVEIQIREQKTIDKLLAMAKAAQPG